MINNSTGRFGSDRNRSVTHIKTVSTGPRDMPAMAPISVPSVSATSIAAIPTAREIRPP